jgi:hypothetical protein
VHARAFRRYHLVRLFAEDPSVDSLLRPIAFRLPQLENWPQPR